MNYVPIYLIASSAALGTFWYTCEDAVAEKTAHDFLMRLSERDLDKTLELTEVPFCWSAETILKDNEVLKNRAKALFKAKEKSKVGADRVAPKLRLISVGTVDQVRNYEVAGKKLQESPVFKGRYSLSSVLKQADDRIVLFETIRDNPSRSGMVFVGVRIRDGKGFVVGFFN